MKHHSQQLHTESGFVILFSILISTIILIMSAGIFQIAQKETILSSYSRESQTAFYAADAGVECGLFYDIGLITQTRFSRDQVNGTLTPDFTCGTDASGNQTTINAYKYNVNGVYDHVFGFRYASPGDDLGCSFVFVEKNDPAPVNPGDPLNPTEVRITAVGYNTCDGNVPNLEDPTLLERRLSVRYLNI